MAEPAVAFDLPLYETLLLEDVGDGVLVLRLNRPHRMNSMTPRMLYEIAEVGRYLRDCGARALVITGAGERMFCAGFDIDEVGILTEMGTREFLRFVEMVTGGMAAIRFLPFPVVAAARGGTSGGGLSLALAADIRICDPTVKLSAGFVNVGLSVGELGTSYNLTRLVGPGRAAELAFTGRPVGAEEALRIGLVNRVVASESLLDEALAIARQIAGNPASAVRMSKRALQRNLEVGSYRQALELENRGQALLTRTAEMPAALAAFRR